MYQALYRKWRPRTFDDVVGQEHVTETLKNQVQNGHLSHAYLFVGTRGTGKTTCAKILAKAVNCEHPVNGNPCNECASCRGIDDGSIMDVVELDAASNNSVENVRALRDEAVFSPVSVKKRVYIIDEVHMLSNSAFNALLKILEEPPEHLMFILATTELQKVPATILSRCQRHSFKRISPEALAGRIRYVAEQENMRLEPDAADLLSRLADGSLRDGLSLLDQCAGYDDITAENVLSAMGLAGNLRIAELLQKISDQDTDGALYIFTGLYQDGKSPVSLLRELSALLRDILMCQVAPKGAAALLSGSFSKETLKAFSAQMTKEELLRSLDTVQAHIAALRDGRDPRTTAELCIVMLSQPQLGESDSALAARISRLEKKLDDTSVHITHRENEECENRTDVSSRENAREIISDTSKTSAAKNEKSSAMVVSSAEEEPHFALDEPPEAMKPTAAQMPHHPSESAPPERERPAIAHPETAGDSFEEPDPDTEPEERVFSDADAPPVNNADISAGQTPADDELWQKVSKALLPGLNPGQVSVIKNQTSGSFDGNVLTICAANAFARAQLEQSAMMELLRQAAESAAGRPIPVKVIQSENGPGGNTEKLKADLSHFGNVKFE